ncbi:TPA: hypothetical protein UN084_002729 [Stenotrophomonas maltophilia]|nr:hypothetical protein [Stenotrophomonas maltophilia]
MNYLERQVEIIGLLFRAMDGSAEEGYSSAACRFRYLPEDDGSLGVDSSFRYSIEGVSVSALLNDMGDKSCVELVCDLHDVMRMHTGGNWTEFDIVVNSDKTVTAQFFYSA